MPTITSSTGTRKALIGILILWFLLSLGGLLLGVFEGDGVKPAFLVILYVAFLSLFSGLLTQTLFHFERLFCP